MSDYPTEEELKEITTAPHDKVLDMARALWYYPEYWRTKPAPRGEIGVHHLVSTGGWSGNESIIEAMMGNNLFWLIHWQSSTRGGHYVFIE